MTNSQIYEFFQLWVSWPGALITVAICITLVLFIAILKGKDVRSLVGSFRYKGEEVEFGTMQQSTESVDDQQDRGNEEPKAYVEPEKENEEQALVAELENEPKSTEQTERQLDLEMFFGYYERDLEKLDNAYEKLKAFPDRESQDEWLDSEYHDFRLLIGAPGAQQAFEQLESDQNEWVEPSIRLARFFLSIESLEFARKHIEIGLERAKTEVDQASLQLLRADLTIRTGNSESAINDLYDVFGQFSEANQKCRMLSKIAEIHDELKQFHAAHLALERALDIDPSNKDRRFKLAYSYKQHVIGDNDPASLLSYYHYQILIKQDEKYFSALNNLGGLCGDLGLNIKNVECWKEASGFNFPYPAGNLAIKLSNEGFIEEARAYLDNLPDENKGKTRAAEAETAITNIKKEEEEKEKIISENGKIFHDFIISVATIFSNSNNTFFPLRLFWRVGFAR